MKKKFFGKVVSMLSVLAMLVTCVAAVPAYAAEVDTNDTAAVAAEASVMPRDGVETFAYGTTTQLSGFLMHNTNTTPTKTASPDLRTHRMVVNVKFHIASVDSNQTPITLTLKVKRANGTMETIGQATAYSQFHYYELQSEWFTVSPGEQFQFFFDVSTAPEGTSTGSYRYAQISEWAVYCD